MQKGNQLKSCCKKMLSSREVVARDLPHPMPLSLLNRKQQPYFMREAEDPGTLRAAKPSGMTNFFNNGNICPTLYSVQKHYGMTSVGRGFTLIELLVVVLIIGILAAVAVPQYQKAVEKSKATQALTLLKSMYQAAQTHLLASGQWPGTIADIDLEVPSVLADWRIDFYATDLSSMSRGANHSILITRTQGAYMGAGFIIYEDRDTNYKDNVEMDRILCIERKRHDQTTRFTKEQGDYCQKIMQGTLLDASDGNPVFTMSY